MHMEVESGDARRDALMALRLYEEVLMGLKGQLIGAIRSHALEHCGEKPGVLLPPVRKVAGEIVYSEDFKRMVVASILEYQCRYGESLLKVVTLVAKALCLKRMQVCRWLKEEASCKP